MSLTLPFTVEFSKSESSIVSSPTSDVTYNALVTPRVVFKNQRPLMLIVDDFDSNIVNKLLSV